jgi:hypothetical protein
MKNLLRLEEIAFFILSIYALYVLEAQWWFYLLLLLGPDISMLGYLAGPKVGAITYNLFHHKFTAIAFFLVGIISSTWMLQVVGTVLFGHSSLDRIFGYGLKYYSGFSDTHLGTIGLKQELIVVK